MGKVLQTDAVEKKKKKERKEPLYFIRMFTVFPFLDDNKDFSVKSLYLTLEIDCFVFRAS